MNMNLLIGKSKVVSIIMGTDNYHCEVSQFAQLCKVM